ncbi:MAG: diacylglycerol kinase family lipid kinase [Dehalococcoidia bacterium]|nr:diacylglycerol kinase family lipid kinase [Dehalococcoidia bacterium]
MRNKRCLLIFNPTARGAPSVEKLQACLRWLEQEEWDAALTLTEERGHAISLARRAAEEGTEIVVACGGDGTVNEVTNGLAGSASALAVIPGGTANVWAKEVRIPRNPLRAVRLLAEGEVRRVDLGRVRFHSGGERYFLLMAGVGLDGHIVGIVPERLKRRLGAAAYVVHGLREALRYRSTRTTLAIDGSPLEAELNWLLAGNTRSYGGVVNVARQACADDGLLDVYVFQGHGVRRMFVHGLRILARAHERAPGVVYMRAKDIELAEPCALPVQVDGDFVGLAPLTMSVAPAALAVVVPAGVKSPLFQQALP